MVLFVYSYYALFYNFKTYSEAAFTYEMVADVGQYQSEFLFNSH